MGMFPEQNYGADFINAMAATSGMLNDRRRLDMEEKRMTDEQKTRDLQQEGLALENEQRKMQVDQAKSVQSYLDLSQRLNAGSLTPDDYSRLTKVTGDIMQAAPYLPSDPQQIPQYRQALTTVVQGIQSVRTLPPGDYIYTRADNVPEVNSTLDAYRTLLSKDRLGKEFTDTDGKITGTPGATYRTADVGGFFMRSGEGEQGQFTPLFSVTDGQGNPLVGADGRPKLVPATRGQSNDQSDPVASNPAEQLLAKAGFAYNVLDTAQKLGLDNPATANRTVTAGLRSAMGTEGAKELLRQADEEEKTQRQQRTQYAINAGVAKAIESVPPGSGREEYTRAIMATGLVPAKDAGEIARAVTEQPDQIKTTVAGVGNGMEQTFQYNPKTGRFDVAIGKPTAKWNPSSTAGEGGKLPAEAQLVEYYKNRLGISYDDAVDLVKHGKSKPEDMAVAIYTKMKADPNNMDKPDEQIRSEAAAAAEYFIGKFGGRGRRNGSSTNDNSKGPRDTSDLTGFFNGVKFYERSATAIDSALAQGWTPAEIKQAARGTPVEKTALNYDYAATPAAVVQNQAPRQSPQGAAKHSKPAKPAQANAVVKNGRIVVDFN